MFVIVYALTCTFKSIFRWLETFSQWFISTNSVFIIQCDGGLGSTVGAGGSLNRAPAYAMFPPSSLGLGVPLLFSSADENWPSLFDRPNFGDPLGELSKCSGELFLECLLCGLLPGLWFGCFIFAAQVIGKKSMDFFELIKHTLLNRENVKIFCKTKSTSVKVICKQRFQYGGPKYNNLPSKLSFPNFSKAKPNPWILFSSSLIWRISD